MNLWLCSILSVTYVTSSLLLPAKVGGATEEARVSGKNPSALKHNELHIAVRTDDIDSVGHLLRAGVDPNVVNKVRKLPKTLTMSDVSN